jgi:hypothetical protein
MGDDSTDSTMSWSTIRRGAKGGAEKQQEVSGWRRKKTELLQLTPKASQRQSCCPQAVRSYTKQWWALSGRQWRLRRRLRRSGGAWGDPRRLRPPDRASRWRLRRHLGLFRW